MLNEHLISTIDKLFPGRKFSNYLTILFYPIGEYFSNGDRNSSAMDSPDEKDNAARHCQGVYGREREYTIRALAADGHSEVPGKWEAIPAYDQICEVHAVDVRDCRVKKCTRYVKAEKFLIVAREADAVSRSFSNER